MLHTVTVPLKEYQMSMVDETVYHGGCHLVIREDAPPLGEFKVRCQKKALALIAVRYDTE